MGIWPLSHELLLQRQPGEFLSSHSSGVSCHLSAPFTAVLPLMPITWMKNRFNAPLVQAEGTIIMKVIDIVPANSIDQADVLNPPWQQQSAGFLYRRQTLLHPEEHR